MALFGLSPAMASLCSLLFVSIALCSASPIPLGTDGTDLGSSIEKQPSLRSPRDTHHQANINRAIKADDIVIHGSAQFTIGNIRRNKRDASQLDTTAVGKSDLPRTKRHFRGAVHIVDRRTRPGPPVNLDNLQGEGSVQVIIDDNTDPVSLRNARVIGSAQIMIQ